MKKFYFYFAVLKLFSVASLAAESFSFNYSDQEITKIVGDYAKRSGKKFVVDASVRGKVSILGADSVSLSESYELLSSTLAINGYAISVQKDINVVTSARLVERSLFEVTTEVPALKPERMVSYVYTFKNMSASDALRELRIFSSRDGECTTVPSSNKIIFTDWASNLQRIVATLKEIDVPLDENSKRILEKEMERKNSAKAMSQKNGTTSLQHGVPRSEKLQLESSSSSK